MDNAIRERIVLLDPRERLGLLKNGLARTGRPLEELARAEDLVGPGDERSSQLLPTVVVVDGEEESGLSPRLSRNLQDVAPELPLVVLAVVSDRQRGQLWIEGGASSFLLSPVSQGELEAAVGRGLQFAHRLGKITTRLESIQRSFAMLTHDLRNPLNAILGYCQLASLHPEMPREAGEDLSRIQRNVDLLCSMTDGFLEMVRGDGCLHIFPRKTDLSGVVNDAVELMLVRARARNTTIIFQPGDPAPVLTLDPHRMIEAIANILDNAIKFSPDETRVEVGIKVLPSEAVITIDDEGPGISPSDLDRIFDRFFHAQGGGDQDGLGLGLSIAREIIELHRGTIFVEERSPRGTRFGIRLPRNLEQVDTSGAVPSAGANSLPGEKQGGKA